MAKIAVHGGDFQKGAGWFYSPRAEFGGFVLRDLHGRPERIPPASIATAEPASEAAIRALGDGEAMVEALERLSADERAGAFVALFSDGRLLLGLTDPETREAICAGRRRKVH